jgi:hypothetical protein
VLTPLPTPGAEIKTREEKTKMVKIDAKTRESIKSILFSRIDSQKLSDSSQESVYRELLPILHRDVPLDHFKTALFRFVEKRRENPKNAFNLFIESLEISIIGRGSEIENTGERVGPNKKGKALSARGDRNTKGSRKHQSLDKSGTDEGRQELKQAQMRMDDSNRLMATARHPDYIEDWNDFVKELGKGSSNHEAIGIFHKELCKKWKLESPVPPHLGKEDEAWRTISHVNQREAILELTEDQWPNRLVEIHQRAEGKCICVRLKIDLTRREKELGKAFVDKLRSWTKGISKDGRSRKTKYDPWKIYDMKHDESLSLNRIAQKLYGKELPRGKRTPVYTEKLWQPYKRVDRAYAQAKKMIQAVRPLHSYPIRDLFDA